MDTTDPKTAAAPDAALDRLDKLANLLDNQFAIPGTKYRFGIDALVGLVPYLGDMSGFIVSGILLRTMIQKGAGPLLMLRMLWNVSIDALVGIVPVIGDLFDFGYKANRRNVDLLRAYYADGKAKPSAKGSIAFLGFFMLLLFAGMIWLVWKLAAMFFQWLF